MAEIMPRGVIHLLKSVPLCSDYINTFWFANETAQYTHFQTQYTNVTFQRQYYQRKNRGWLRVQASYSQVWNVNYMMFKNTPATELNSSTVVRSGYEDKWWYAFVDKIDYINDNVVEIHYSIDVIQSYLFNVSFENTFVERMTPITDAVGDNMVDEGIPIGDYAYGATGEMWFRKFGTSVGHISLHQGMRPIVAATCNMDYEDSTDGVATTTQQSGNGIVMGCLMVDPYFYDVQGHPNPDKGCKAWLDAMPGEKYGAILGIVMMPEAFRRGVSSNGTDSPIVSSNTMGHLISANIAKPSTLGTYTPTNKKLLCYPYNSLMINSSDGTSQVFAYELMNKTLNYINFRLDYVYTFPLQGVLYPNDDYKMQTNSLYQIPYMMPLPQLPTCTWSNDTFKAWAAMNTGYTALSIAGSILDMATVVGGALAGGMLGNGTEVLAQGAGQIANSGTGLIPFGTEGAADVPYTITGQTSSAFGNMSDVGRQVGGMRMVGDIMNIGRSLINVHNAKILPDSFNGSSSNLASVVSEKFGYSYCQRCIREDYARQIDDYFTMFGYALKRIVALSLNELHHRTRFTYIKTANMDIGGFIPSDDKELFCQIFNKGIRFWSDPTTVGNYTNANGFLS